MDKSAVVAIIDELEAKGLTRRVRPAHDRRRHALTLTAQGDALMRKMVGPVSLAGLPIRQALTKPEMEQLLSLLDRAYHALAAAEEAGEPQVDKLEGIHGRAHARRPA
jgi:DNA-binding MarR family transcriptional regulator